MSEPGTARQDPPQSPEELAQDNDRQQVLSRRAAAAGGAPDRKPWAVAFSGGGIRSATFCLGLARALAHNDVWRRFDYLSTVSGGGYIGSALGRLYGPKAKADEVTEGLKDDHSLFLWWLRRNGRFLLPAGASDAMRSGAGYFRGFLATQFEVAVISVLASCLIMIPHLVMTVYQPTREWGRSFASPLWSLLPVAAALSLAFMFAYWFTRDPKEKEGKSRDGLLSLGSLAVAGGCIALALALKNAECDTDVLWPMLLGAGVLLGMLFFGWILHKGYSDAFVSEARIRWTARLAVGLALCGGLGLIGLLDLLSWILAERLAHSGFKLAAGGVSLTLILVTVVRAAVPAVQKLAKEYGIASAPERVAHFAGLLLTVMVTGFWLLATQWFVFFGPEICQVLCTTCAQDELKQLLCTNATPMRWLILLVVTLGYVKATGRNAEQLNRASLYPIYRSRLARAYLSVGNSPDHGYLSGARFGFSPLGGASAAATADLGKVTEYLEQDDTLIGEYRPQDYGGPIHLINCCINQTVDDSTDAYNADRKGEALVVSSLGHEVGVRWTGTSARVESSKLSQWVAVSGAAVGSGMGSATKPGVAALSFLTGVRIGFWWNPEGTLHSLAKYRATVREWFGRFPGRTSDVLYLSDGGHFDNTGVYALLKRKPEIIVVADCGADPNYVFGDLENLIRKARIDYCATIEILNPETFPANPEVDPIKGLFGTPDNITPSPGKECLILARIRYAQDPGEATPMVGTVLIVKPRRLLSLSLDVAGYSDKDTNFPQQTTADQFFDEAQWESYCQLGRDLGDRITPAVLEELAVVAKQAEPAPTMSISANPEKVKQETTGSRRERLTSNVGKTLSIGAALSALVAGWQIWQDTRATLRQSETDELETVKSLLSGPETQNDLLQRLQEKGVMSTLESVINGLEQLGSIHGQDAMDRAREKVAEGLYQKCALSLRDASGADVSKCAVALAVLTTRPRSSWALDVDNFWDQSVVLKDSMPSETCSKGVAGGRTYLLVHEGSRPDAHFLDRVRVAASDRGLRYVRDTSDGFGIPQERRSGKFKIEAPALLSSVFDDDCGEELLESLRKDRLQIKSQIPPPMFSHSVGLLQFWIPQQSDAPPPSETAQFEKVLPMLQLPIADAQMVYQNAFQLSVSEPEAPRPITIYVQFQGSFTRTQINDFREGLKARVEGVDAGKRTVTIPGAERRPEAFSNTVRYFREVDKDDAVAIAEQTAAYFEELKCALKPAIEAKFSELKAPPGQIEVWVKPACPREAPK